MSTPAQAAGRVILAHPTGRRLLAWALGCLALLVLLPILALVSLLATGPQTPIGVAGGIPAVYAPMYQAAGAAYRINPFLLAALHKTESDFSRDPAAFTPNSAGALGPLQFLPSTWAGYREAWRALATRRPASYPHMCPTHGCITDDFDAIAAAASYLHQLGADSTLGQATFGALIRYKGTPPASIPYARETLALAQQLESENSAGSGMPVQAAGGPLIDRLITVADEITAARIGYCYGGGHLTPARPSHGSYCHDANNNHISGSAYDGLDCSSAVSMLLQQSGVNTATLDSTGFMGFAQAGVGVRFTIWANPAHVFVVLDGRGWGTSDSNPYGGPGWAPHTTVGFTPRHLQGL
jgi:hypothetical protein